MVVGRHRGGYPLAFVQLPFPSESIGEANHLEQSTARAPNVCTLQVIPSPFLVASLQPQLLVVSLTAPRCAMFFQNKDMQPSAEDMQPQADQFDQAYPVQSTSPEYLDQVPPYPK